MEIQSENMQIMGLSLQLEPKVGKDYSMLMNISKEKQETISKNIQSATVGSVALNKKMTSTNKSNSCKKNIQNQKSYQISDLESTTKEKDLTPYWNGQCKEINSKLWLPTKTALQGLDLNLSNQLSKKMVEKSWFSTELNYHHKKNLQKIFSKSSMYSHAGSMECENTITKSKKIKIYPTTKQKQLLNMWMGVSRYTYNQTIDYLKQKDSSNNWFKIKTNLLNSLPDWSKQTPFQIKSIAIRDACNASKNNIKRYKQTNKFQKLRYRSKKNLIQSIYIPKSAIKPNGMYVRLLKDLKYSEDLPDNVLDSRLIKENNKYYLHISYKIKIRNNMNDNQGRVVSIDPGIRSFITFFSENSCGKIAKYSISRIQRLCVHLDDLICRISKAKSKKKKRMKIAANRIRIKIRNLISELHWKSIKFLLDNFDVVLLPEFNSSDMVKKGKRKINKKSVRQMLTYSHYLFRQRILQKAKERNKKVILCNESYTSKTASWSGEIVNNLGSRKEIKSKGIVMDRDYNGARGICLV
jgi:putative transposase